MEMPAADERIDLLLPFRNNCRTHCAMTFLLPVGFNYTVTNRRIQKLLTLESRIGP